MSAAAMARVHGENEGKRMIRVVLVDDHALVRTGLRMILQQSTLD